CLGRMRRISAAVGGAAHTEAVPPHRSRQPAISPAPMRAFAIHVSFHHREPADCTLSNLRQPLRRLFSTKPPKALRSAQEASSGDLSETAAITIRGAGGPPASFPAGGPPASRRKLAPCLCGFPLLIS